MVPKSRIKTATRSTGMMKVSSTGAEESEDTSNIGSVIFPLDYQRNGHITDDVSIRSHSEYVYALTILGL